jgi:hypothetical protein
MEIGSLNVTFTSNLNQLEQGNKQAQSSTEQVAASMRKATASTDALQAATEKLTGSRRRHVKIEEEGVNTSANLGRAMRVLTTSILGVNLASIALGTALGNILTQAVSQVVVAITASITQFARFHNELLLVEKIGGRAGQTMQFLLDISRQTGAPLADLVERYKLLAQTIQGTNITLEESRRLFRAQEQALAGQREDTLLGGTRQLLDAVGQLVVAFDKILQISNAVVLVLRVVTHFVSSAAAGARTFHDFMVDLVTGGVYSQIQNFNQSIQSTSEQTLRTMLATRQARFEELRATGQVNEILGQIVLPTEEVRRLTGEINGILAEIARRLQLSSVVEARAIDLRERTAQQLRFQARLMGENRNEAEVLTRVEQIRLQFLALGVVASETALANWRILVREAQAVELSMRNQLAAAQGMVTALSGVPVAFGNIFTTSGLDVLRNGFTGFTQEITGFHTQAFIDANIAMEDAMRRNGATAQEIFNMKRGLLTQEQRLIGDTAGKVASAITAVFPKSKAAAIGAAVINTAVAITQALGLPWPFNWIQAAAVAASGAAQIASIRSSSPSGGSTPSVGGGGGAAADAGGSMPQMITIELQKGALFSSEQVVGLMELMNEQVRNGGALIATRLT